MYLTLEKILRTVAKDKGLKNPTKWVKSKMEHCEVHSDTCDHIHLLSNRWMHFGIMDASFDCPPFILYREMVNNDRVSECKEIEIYTFRDLEDAQFKNILIDSYKFHYDTIKDLRLYYNLIPVYHRMKTECGFIALGEYNELEEDDFEVETSLYSLCVKGSNLFVYAVHRELLELHIQKLTTFFEWIAETEGEDDTTQGVYVSDIVTVKKLGEPIPFELLRSEGGEWSVRWHEKGVDPE